MLFIDIEVEDGYLGGRPAETLDAVFARDALRE